MIRDAVAMRCASPRLIKSFLNALAIRMTIAAAQTGNFYWCGDSSSTVMMSRLSATKLGDLDGRLASGTVLLGGRAPVDRDVTGGSRALISGIWVSAPSPSSIHSNPSPA